MTDIRVEELSKLEEFIRINEDKLNILLKELDWNKNNTIKETTSRKNTSDCKPALGFPSQHGKFNVVIDSETLGNILTSNGSRNEASRVSRDSKFTNFELSQPERLAIYEYVINKAGRLSEPETSNICREEKNLNKNVAKNVAEYDRNTKRRRAKSPTTKPPPLSYTEELRRLINLQMHSLCNNNATQIVSPHKLIRGDDDKLSYKSKEPSHHRSKNKHNSKKKRHKPHKRRSIRDDEQCRLTEVGEKSKKKHKQHKHKHTKKHKYS